MGAALAALLAATGVVGWRLGAEWLDGAAQNPGIGLAALALGAWGVGRALAAPAAPPSPAARAAARRWARAGGGGGALGLALALASLEARALPSLSPRLWGWGVEAWRVAELWAQWGGLWCAWRAVALWRGAGAAALAPSVLALLALPWESPLRALNLPLQRLGASSAQGLLWVAGQVDPRLAARLWDDHTLYTPEFYLIVDETCAGVNLLLSSALYAAGFTWAVGGSGRAALWLVALSLPLSLAANAARIALIFALGCYGGVELAMGPWHEGSAYVTQAPALLALAWAEGRLRG
ncbi:MAG: exosortase/archaeosortase family protein, partial [Deltaproteobacteria bacterium]|nr:exosortase/archaeosortase family protein [Deltaproteobacteria bacterium]